MRLGRKSYDCEPDKLGVKKWSHGAFKGLGISFFLLLFIEVTRCDENASVM